MPLYICTACGTQYPESAQAPAQCVICEEERQLLRQRRMHGVLHAWLIIHVPLSFALMVLAVVHIVMALKY